MRHFRRRPAERSVRRRPRAFWSALALGGAIAVGALAGSAHAATQTKYYALRAAPASIGTGSTTALTFTLRNCGGTSTSGDCAPASTQTLGSADITVPSSSGLSFTVPTSYTSAGITAPDGKSWSVCLGDGTTCGGGLRNVLQLRSAGSGDGIAPGQAVRLTLNVTASCTPASSTWTSQVKQSNNFSGSGNDFAQTGSPPTVSVVAGLTLDHFNVGLPSSPYTATAGTPFTVTVTAKDTCGNTVTSYGGAGQLSGNLASGNGFVPSVTDVTGGSTAASPFPATITFSHGVSLPAVTAYVAETGRSLTYGSATSDAFAVVPGAPASTRFTQQPLSGGSADWIVAAVFGTEVTLYDAYGNVAANATGNVTLSLNAPKLAAPGSAPPFAASQAPNAGVATFTGLSITQPGIGYTLRAGYSGGVVSLGSSSPFSVFQSLTSCSGTSCTTPTVTLDGNTTGQVDGSGSFAFIGVNSATLGGRIPAGCANFSSVGGAPFVVVDQRTTLSGDLYVTYAVAKTLIDKRYSNTRGQQFIPICIGAARIDLAGATGKTYSVACDQSYEGQPQTGWTGKTLDSTGSFVPGLSAAVCDPDTGYFFGIVGSFQDYTNSDPSLEIDPSTSPTVTAWTSDTVYRYFTIRFPSASGAGIFAVAPWDGFGMT